MGSPSVGICPGLINVTSTLATRVRQIAVGLESAGQGREFDDILELFSVTSTALRHLQTLFRSPSIPSSLVSEYEREVRICLGRLDDIESTLNQVVKNLNNKSFFKRLSQKRDLVDGELRRATGKLSALNQSLQLLVAAHNSRVIALVHEGVSRVESRVSFPRDEVNISLQYIEAAKKSQMEDWEDARIPKSYWKPDVTSPVLPIYEEIQSEPNATNNIMDTSGYSLKHPKLPPKLPMRVVDPRGEPPVHELPASELPRHELSAPMGMSGYFPGPMAQGPILPSKIQDETLRSAAGMSRHMSGLTPQEKVFVNAQKVQDEEWRVWQQARRDAYTTYEM